MLRLRRLLDKGLAGVPFVKRALRPVYCAMAKARYAEFVRPNASLKDRYRGRRLFVLCTGPSIDEIDFSMLHGQAVMGISFLVKHHRFQELPVMFYADLERIHSVMNKQTVRDLLSPPDGVVVHPHNAEAVIADLYSLNAELGDPSIIHDTPSLFYGAIDEECRNPETRFFFNVSNKAFFERHHLFKGRSVSWIMKAAPSMALAARQSHDLAWAPTFVDGVVFFAVAAGIYMGFSEIVLVGAGYTYSPLQYFHFYDIPIASPEYCAREARIVLDRLAQSRGLRVRSVERVHKGYRPVLVRDRAVDPRHQLLKEYAEAHGTKVYNLVPEGFGSPVYPAVTRRFVEEEWLTAPATEIPYVP